MNRREFLSSTALVGSSVIYHRAFGDGFRLSRSDSSSASVPGRLSIALDSPSHIVPANYLGLSYELAQLSDPRFFSRSNHALMALFRLLSPCGVLRLGGNSSESCWLKAEPSTKPPALPRVTVPASEHWMPRELFMIPLEAISELAGFLRTTGWKLVYGLNFGHSSPDRLAREAEIVDSIIRDNLLYFQIGNEPDFYAALNNRTRPPNWGFRDYIREWTACVDAIVQRVPEAKFGGPDVGASSDWIAQFIPAAREKLGPRLVAVTGHYYAEGPPDDPNVTTERLLRSDPKVGLSAKAICDLAAQNQLIYRMTEGNSCYRGGKPGMSDALASALWGGDYLLTLATAGCKGVNLHGGSRNLLRAALGNKLPGERVAKIGSDTRGGYYTPIAGELDHGFTARPLYYGMLLANQMAGTEMKAVSLYTGGLNVTAYAGRLPNGEWRIAIFNKELYRTQELTIQAPPLSRGCRAWRLVGPHLDATTGISLAGAEVGPDFDWSPRNVENLSVTDDHVRLDLPCATAALFFFETPDVR